MTRKLILENKEGRREINYSLFSLEEIDRQIKAYEHKYGVRLTEFVLGITCDSLLPDEEQDLWDWECLTEERKDRTRN